MMVVYHSASSSRDAQVNLGVTYAIPFIHGAFLAITGFLCGYHYWPMIHRSRETVVKRLFVRAAKLALLFAACNIALCVMGVGPQLGRLPVVLGDVRAVATNCIVGISGEYFSFEVLMYIAEFLCLAAMVARYSRVAHPILAVVVFLAVIVGGNTLLFLAFGAVGMEVGIAAGKGWLLAYDRRLRKARIALLLFLAASTVIRSGYEPLVSNAVKLPLRFIETILWFYVFVGFAGGWQWCVDRLVILGKYTLFAYLFQMFVLRVLVRTGDSTGVSGWHGYFLHAIITMIVTYAAVILLDQLRRRDEVDAFYRLAFG